MKKVRGTAKAKVGAGKKVCIFMLLILEMDILSALLILVLSMVNLIFVSLFSFSKYIHWLEHWTRKWIELFFQNNILSPDSICFFSLLNQVFSLSNLRHAA